MTTTLAAIPVTTGQLDLLSAIEDDVATPEDFKAACIAVARDGGWVNPNEVSAHLHARFGAIKPQWYSAQWAPACGPNGFMTKTEHRVAIDPTHSRGNGNKEVLWRRLGGWSA